MSPAPDCPVSSVQRKSVTAFAVRAALISEYNATGQTGAQLVIPANPRRIAAVIFSPASNGGIVFWGAQDLAPALGGSGVNGYDMEPGTGWLIDDTRDAIYMFSQPAAGRQVVKWHEVVDKGREPA